MIRLTADQVYYQRRVPCLKAHLIITTMLTHSHWQQLPFVFLVARKSRPVPMHDLIRRDGKRRGDSGQCRQLKWLVLPNRHCRAIRTCDPSVRDPPMCVWRGGACVRACVHVLAGDSECRVVVFQWVSVSLCFVWLSMCSNALLCYYVKDFCVFMQSLLLFN